MDPHPYRSPSHRLLSPEHSQPLVRGRPQDPWGRMGPSAPQRSTRAPQPWSRMGTLDTQGRMGPPSPRSRTGPPAPQAGQDPSPWGRMGPPRPASTAPPLPPPAGAPTAPHVTSVPNCGQCHCWPGQCPQVMPCGPTPPRHCRGLTHGTGAAGTGSPGAVIQQEGRGRGRQRAGHRRTRCPHADPRPCATPRWGQSHRVPRDRVSRPLPTGAAGTALPHLPRTGRPKIPTGRPGSPKIARVV